MRIDFCDLEPRARYKLLCAAVVPRPIAWITTKSVSGAVNAAPFSFFNVFGEDPPLLILGLQHRPDRERKDTTRNIAETGEFVVNIATLALLDRMVATAADFPPETDELKTCGIETAPSTHVAPPRIAEAPVAFECRRHTRLEFGPDREIMVGEVIAMHAREGLVDPRNWHVDWKNDLPVARLHGDRYGVIETQIRRSVPAPAATFSIED